MSKVAVVYWSSTGNTEAMANAVAEGAKAAGAEVISFESADFSADKVDEWEMKFWKKMNSNRCSTPVRQNFPAKRLDFSDLMDGAMENGCITGKINAKKTGLFLSLTV